MPAKFRSDAMLLIFASTLAIRSDAVLLIFASTFATRSAGCYAIDLYFYTCHQK